jgi:hypothetical protein
MPNFVSQKTKNGSRPAEEIASEDHGFSRHAIKPNCFRVIIESPVMALQLA